LLDWFSHHARALPWRRTLDPYAIWVSEIMLQQTQVKTVIPYWERWMRALPTIKSVAKAPSAKLHKLWEGLGYYARVRNLQKAAQQIVALHDGRFPENFNDMLAFPGIGRYTAGAIASIAFNQPRPILDGNVIRVLTRLFGITSDPLEKRANRRLWQIAEALVNRASNITDHSSHAKSRTRTKDEEERACSHFNQSLMELGALICAPRNPRCNECPVRNLCVARCRGWQEKLPKPRKEPATTARRFVAFIVERNGKFLVRQRPNGVVNAHLWEFPNVEIKVEVGRARHSVRSEARISNVGAQRTDAPYQRTDFRLVAAKPLCTIKHSITRYRITLEAWRAELPMTSNSTPGRWFTTAQLNKLAFTSAHRRILNHLD